MSSKKTISRASSPSRRPRGLARAEAAREYTREKGTGHAAVRDLPRRDPASYRGHTAVHADELRLVNRVGETKLTRYGQQILDVLAEPA